MAKKTLERIESPIHIRETVQDKEWLVTDDRDAKRRMKFTDKKAALKVFRAEFAKTLLTAEQRMALEEQEEMRKIKARIEAGLTAFADEDDEDDEGGEGGEGGEPAVIGESEA